MREVRGCVTDATLAGPLPELAVRLSVGEAVVAESRTDLEGCYRLRWEEGRAPVDSPGGEARIEVRDGNLGRLAETSFRLEDAAGTAFEVDFSIPAERLAQGADGDGDLRFLHGEPVHLAAAARLSTRGLGEAYRFLKHPHRDAQNIDLIQRAFPNTRTRLPEPPFALGECTDGWGDAMRRLSAERGVPLGDHDGDRLPPGAPVRHFYGERVHVVFTTDDAYPQDRVDPTLPPADEEILLQSGLSVGWVRHRLADVGVKNSEVAPAYIQRIALYCEAFLAALTRAPFSLRDPRGGAEGSERLEVRVLHQAPFAGTTHPALDHIQVGPRNSDEVLRRVLPYLLFLRCAYRYNATSTPRGLRDALRHGAASMVAEMLGGQGADAGVDPNLALPPASSLLDDPEGPRKAARFSRRMWRTFARQHGVELPDQDLGTAGGFDFVRRMLEGSARPELGYESEALRVARRGLPWWGSFDRFIGQGSRSSVEEAREVSWGNWLIANTIDGLGVVSADRRFELAPRDRTSRRLAGRGGERGRRPLSQGILGSNGDLRLARGGRLEHRVVGLAPWSARTFRIQPRRGERLRALSVRLRTLAGMGDVLIQLLRIGADGTLTEVHRSEDAGFRKALSFDGLGSLVVIVAGRDAGGSFALEVAEHEEISDVMVTPPNARAGSEGCVDPSAWGWAWLSPDIMVDNDDDGRADSLLPVGSDNKLKVRLRNRGNVRSGSVRVRFWYQSAALMPGEDGWMPVRNAAGERQELQGLRLDPDEFRWFTVSWAPVDDGSGETGYRVRVEVLEAQRSGSARPEPNGDNKVSSTVIKRIRPVNDPDFMDVTVRSVGLGKTCGICPVPHGPSWTAERDEEPQPEDSQFGVSRARFRLTRRGSRTPFPEGTKERHPSPSHYYPLDPRTLPPGVEDSEWITLVAEIPGEAVSGVSFQIGNQVARVIRGTPGPAETGSGPSTLLS